MEPPKLMPTPAPKHKSDRATLTATLIASCTLYRDLQEQATEIDKQKKALMKEIAPIAKSLNIQSEVISPGIRIRLSSISSLKKERLLEKGVSMDVIDYATVETSFYKVEKASE